jgi:hypothetical protein
VLPSSGEGKKKPTLLGTLESGQVLVSSYSEFHTTERVHKPAIPGRECSSGQTKFRASSSGFRPVRDFHDRMLFQLQRTQGNGSG